MRIHLPRFINFRLIAYALFWSWNAIFLAFMLLGFAPLILLDLVTAVQANIIPLAFLVYALLLIAIPIACVILGLTLLREEPYKLFALGYAVEGPLMLLVAIRFFVVRELTPPLTFLLIVAALGMATFVWQLLDRRIDSRSAWVTYVRVVGLTLYALVMVYAALWLAFYAIPLAVALIRAFFDFVLHLGDFFSGLWTAFREFPRNLVWIPFAVFGMATLVYSATVFVLMPIAVPILVLGAWRRALRTAFARFGRAPAALLSGTTAATCVMLFVWLNQQPQAAALALLENPPRTFTQAQQLQKQEANLRAGLLNAYLAPQRYISSIGEVQHIRSLYGDVFQAPTESFLGVERAYEIVAVPLLYQPVGKPVENARWNDGALQRESRQAGELYAAYFDTEIVEGERDTVLGSLSSTWDIARAQQILQAAQDQEVHLNTQTLNVIEHGDWAEFELHEEYQNQTGQRQEVVYYITLPESVVITGLWLGNSDNRSERFAYRVAPRGAAQQVYRDQVRVNVDPALVEQIGPRQYRVRAFPIEPKSLGYEQQSDFGFRTSFVKQGPPVHLWLTWRALAIDHQWTLPYLAEKRNVYWDDKTVRTVNSVPFASNTNEWLPPSLSTAVPVQRVTHRVDLPDGQTVVAQPMPANALPALPAHARYAVVLDRSRSMQPHAQAVTDALAQFKTLAQRGSTIDVYLTASPFRGEQAVRVKLDVLDANALTYIGGQNPSQLLQQFSALRGTDTYDAVFVLTDGTGYALGKSDAATQAFAMPLWFVHLDGKFPLGYDDATLEQIQASGGGVTGALSEALARFSTAYALAHASDNASQIAKGDWVDGYFWSVLPTAEADRANNNFAASDELFAPFAARRLILNNVQRERAKLTQLNTLDQLHALAKQYSVVSPYSSMLVLVNEVQHKQLDDAEKQGDRFQRETEEVGETAQQNPFDVTAVPEPHEYVLMAVGVGLLFWFWRKRKARAQTA